MKRFATSLLAPFLLLATAQSITSQQSATQKTPYTEGPIWRLFFMRSEPGQLDNYMKNFKERTYPAIIEEKKQGIILDFKILVNTQNADPQDWDIIVAYQFKDQASYETFLPANAKLEGDLVGGPDGTKVTAAQRAGMKKTLSTVFVKELILK